jgi:anti-sigma B factor antagonist
MGDVGLTIGSVTGGPAPLAITIDGPPPVISVAGELDMSNTNTLAGAIRTVADSTATISLDLDGLEFIDSSGIRTLLMERRWLQSRDCDLVVVSASSRVRRVMEVVNVWRLLSVDAVPRG